MPAPVEMKGKTFGRLTVIREVESRTDTGTTRPRRYFMTKCQCGARKIVEGHALRSGNTLSCRCLHRERAIESNIMRKGKPQAPGVIGGSHQSRWRKQRPPKVFRVKPR
jgi:hypothetical protein